MRNPETGVNLHQVLRDGPFNQGSPSVIGIELDAEKQARADGVRRVGERHVLAALPISSLQQYGVKVEELKATVEMTELGPGFIEGIADRWHGLLDTSEIIEYTDVREIDWRHEVRKPRVTLWVSGSVLNELDRLSFRGESDRVRKRARTFTRGLLEGSKLEEALSPQGLVLRDDGAVRLRVWAPQTMMGLRDTDHLEAAFGLQERGVPIVVITGDTSLIARAKVAGIQAWRPPDELQLKPDPSPREKELELRLRRAELQKPPLLSLEATYTSVANNPAVDVWLTNAPEGGEAKDVTVMWKTDGATNLDTYNRVGGATFGRVQVGADLRFHQSIPATLPPGSRYPIAQLIFQAPPQSIVYEVWASGSHRRLGALRMVDDKYVATGDEQGKTEAP